jgi:hypothetical protein
VWETSWNAVRDDLQRDLRAAKTALDQASRDRETAHAAPRRDVSRCQATDFILKRATKLHDNLETALQLFPCGASEVAISGARWKERGVQKALSKVAHARIFNALHQQYLDGTNYTSAATLLFTAAPGAITWVTFNDHSFKTDILSNDDFRTAMRFSLGLDQTHLVEAARENTPCGHCDTAFPTADHYQAHALTIKAASAGGSTYNTHNHILEAVANCARAVGRHGSLHVTQPSLRFTCTVGYGGGVEFRVLRRFRRDVPSQIHLRFGCSFLFFLRLFFFHLAQLESRGLRGW